MALSEQLDLIKQGVKQWNDWRKNNSLIPVNLSNADLKQLNLNKVALWDANLQGVDFSQANLTKCDLRGANLQGANLQSADLSQSDLRNANFTQANLNKTLLNQANLSGALLIQTELHDANFKQANLTAACFHNCLINQNIVLNDIICNYIYFAPSKMNRYPENGNLESGEFANIIQKDFILVSPEAIILDSDIGAVFDQLPKINNQSKDDILGKTALVIANLIEQASVNLPDSPTLHVKVATKVISSLQNNSEFLNQFQQLKADNRLEELEVLIPNPALKFIIIGLKK
jgi:uncharacterized protein YjbI with pentapeptide repeats